MYYSIFGIIYLSLGIFSFIPPLPFIFYIVVSLESLCSKLAFIEKNNSYYFKKVFNIELRRRSICTNKNFFIFCLNLTYFLTVEKYDWIENNQKNVTEIYEMCDVHSSSLLLFIKI